MNDLFDQKIKSLLAEESLPEIAMPEGHQQRFAARLNKMSPASKRFKTWIRIAAATVIVLAVTGAVSLFVLPNQSQGLAGISSEMKETEDYFRSAIYSEMTQIKQQLNPNTQVIIDDGLRQIELLEVEFDKLKKDLTQSGYDKRVVHAMISNYQNRLLVLENILEQIEQLKKLKNTPYENVL